MSVRERESASYSIILSTRVASRRVDTSSRFILSLFAFYSYISSISSLIIASAVI